MNKREMIHALIDKAIDIEESSQKGAFLCYSSGGGLDLRFCTRADSFHDRIGDTLYLFSFEDHDYQKAENFLEQIKNTPDVEPKVSVTLSAEKARELGLIA